MNETMPASDNLQPTKQPDSQSAGPSRGTTGRLGVLRGAIDAFLKRAFDIIGALLGLVLLSPLLLTAGMAIWLYDRGPALYRSLRVGKDGRAFRLFKFRTMVAGADKLGPGVTARGDTRITPVGRWLRGTKLDELPQLINVLVGDMSLVGPRPEDPRYVAHYTRRQLPVLNARPGMTSAASLIYRHEEAMLAGPDWEAIYIKEIMPAKVAADLHYLSHRSFWSDLGLIVRTVVAMFDLDGKPMHSLNSLLLGLRNRHFFLIDLVLFTALPFAALALRTDGDETLEQYWPSLLVATLLFIVVKLAVFFRGGLYAKYWRYAGIDDMASLAMLGMLALIVQTALFLWVVQPAGWVRSDFPRSVPIIDGLLALGAVGAVRYSVRLADRSWQRRSGRPGGRRVLVAGAGKAGVMIVDELRRNPSLGMVPVAFVDDNPRKQGASIRNLKVTGTCNEIGPIARELHARQVIIAMPTAPGEDIRRIVHICEQADLSAKTVPGVYELLDGTASLNEIRDVKIEDLLRRAPVQTDVGDILELVRGKRVLVTGAGGSIGGELCRQLLRFEPSTLVLLGHGENSIFEIHNELVRLLKARNDASQTGGGAGLHPVIADIRFADDIRAIFEEWRPQVVFHSAAHKHVPLMEMNVREAISNNVRGTRNLLDCALATGVDNFVMISTDKAINPTGVMGASKRVAELLVHHAALLSGKRYVAVRFGNVLGSRGSVVLTFKQQIAAGGPITVTHPDMARYFMTIQEAAQLVLQASTLGESGEVFMLDMGEPVKIVDLARDLIELSGLRSGRDIEIVFSGIRPGEKLVEELLLGSENYSPTRHEKIFEVRNQSRVVEAQFDQLVAALEKAAQRNDIPSILHGLKRLVPEFNPAGGSSEIQGHRATHTIVRRKRHSAARHHDGDGQGMGHNGGNGGNGSNGSVERIVPHTPNGGSDDALSPLAHEQRQSSRKPRT
ncbi:MAG: polysaccharide biosynthesis protein [Chloroflexia bacterium]